MSLADPIADTSRARSDAVAWLRSLFPELELPPRASDDELRLRLADGAVLCEVLRRLCPASLDEGRATAATENDNVRRFIAAVERMGLPIFRVSDLEAGSMAGVVACLLVLRDRFGSRAGEGQNPSFLGRSDSDGCRRWRLAENNRIESMEFSIRENAQAGQERKQMGAKLQRVLRSPVMPEPTSPLSWSEPSSLSRHAGYKFHEVFQLKQGGYSDLPSAKISEMIKSTSLDNAPTQSLLSVVNGILDESIEHKSGEIPYRVACLLRKVILEIERRISTQAEHIRNQNNLIKARQEKYQSRIRVLEALASRTSVQTPANSSATTGQTHVATDRVQLKKMDIDKDDDKRPLLEEDMTRLMKDKEDVVRLTKEKEDMVSLLKEKEYIIRLMKDETAKLMEEKEDMVSLKKSKVEETKQSAHQDADRLIKEKDDIIRLMKEEKDASNQTIIKLKQELEAVRSSYEESCRLLESKKQGVIKQSADENTDMSIKDDIVRLMKEKQDNNRTIMKLKQELEAVRSLYDERCRLLESNKEDVIKLRSDKEHSESIISQLRQELEATKRSHEAHRQQLDIRAAQANKEFEQKVKQAELMLEDSSKRRTELEVLSESRIRTWKQKEFVVNQFVGLQTQNVQGLRLTSVSIRHEILNCQKRWSEELAGFGQRLEVLTNAAENYNAVAAENRKLFNEVQELKGNIRVYCRIRPFLPGEDQKSTSIEYIGDNGELILANPAKQGKEGKKEFTFNKVFGPSATQDEVFKDIQPLIRSVLDGYNVCIFAYGQTGSGKTYTMTGPENATEKEWGVNYRALNDLFNISSSRGDTITYEISVQMIEIYNEQIRDLIGNGGSQKKLGILTTSQPNGLAVPDATMCPVNSTSHVIELMQTGHNNRAMSATALNERSSRSHSVVTIHVKGLDLKTGATLRGSLHLVDLAGSERVDRSAVIGDRLKEAQHINKSLSALGDVIFSLSQKNAHVPYRNSKLTQILQSSLGGHAKTLMFVQVNPDVSSYTETSSTLKFAERVSGVELGVARTNKEGKDVRELMEQLSLLKDTIAKKDEEIDRLQLLKTHTPRLKTVRQADSLLKHSSSSPGMSSLGGKAKSVGTGVVSDSDNLSDTSDRHSEAGSMQSVDDLRQQREIMGLSKLSAAETGQSSADTEFPGFGDANSEGRLSDMSDGDLSMSTETDGSLSSVMEVGPFTQQEKAPTTLKEPKMTTRVQKTASLKASLSSNLRLKPRDPPAPRSSMSTGLRRSTTTQATPSPRTTSTSKRGA